jgi:hypothetical protein
MITIEVDHDICSEAKNIVRRIPVLPAFKVQVMMPLIPLAEDVIH